MEMEKDLSQDLKEQNEVHSEATSDKNEPTIESLKQQLTNLEASCKDFEDK